MTHEREVTPVQIVEKIRAGRVEGKSGVIAVEFWVEGPQPGDPRNTFMLDVEDVTYLADFAKRAGE